MIDPALLRPGRIDKTLYVGLPTQTERVEILKTLTKDGTQPNISPEVKFDELAGSERTEGFSGADLAALIHEASQEAFREFIKSVEDVLFESKCEISNKILCVMFGVCWERSLRFQFLKNWGRNVVDYRLGILTTPLSISYHLTLDNFV